MKTPVGWASIANLPAAGSALLSRAGEILAQEAAKIPKTIAQIPGSVMGAQSSPITSPELPLGALPETDIDRLRREAHNAIEAALAALSPKATIDNRAPLVSAAAPVAAGSDAVVTLRIANEDPAPSEVTLYCSNFVADNGYDISSSRITFSPRSSIVLSNKEASFDATIRIPQQAPPGIYSGLVQAAGSKYIKAIMSVEVK